MLIKDLYTIDRFSNNAGQVEAVVTINANHKIFEGHFPGQPVLPGVCQLQLIKELLEKAADKKLFLLEAGNCKFLQMIVPAHTKVLNITLSYKPEGSTILLNAVIKSDDAVFLKMNATFLPV